MKIVLAVFLITVASALDHHETHSWKRREDFKVAASRSIAPIKVKDARAQRTPPAVQSARKSRPLLKNDVLQTSSRRHSLIEDEQQEFWNSAGVRTRQDLTRENRAIENTLKNMISSRPSLGKLEQYQYFPNFPFGGDESIDAILENAERPKTTTFSRDVQDHLLSPNVGEVDWSAQDIFEKDTQNEGLEEERQQEEGMSIQDFLDEVKRKRLNGEFEELVGGHRQGRRRKLTSQQQGALLVETLRKKRNHTDDHRGHSSNLQNGIMDMLGRSMFLKGRVEKSEAEISSIKM